MGKKGNKKGTRKNKKKRQGEATAGAHLSLEELASHELSACLAFRAAPGDRGELLARVEPDHAAGLKRSVAEKALPLYGQELAGLQERLWAEHTRSLLIVLQGMDTSGKDGTVKHAMGWVNPQGVHLTNFKQPSDEERRHDFLWRIRRALPRPGEIAIFNRSHYEDIVAVRVNRLAPEAEWSMRYEIINGFERELARTGTTIVKLFLHISYDEQRERLLERLDDPNKHWKFSPSDVDARGKWAEYQAAYEDVLERCSTDAAPWYVIPADHKWYRNVIAMKIVWETLERLDPRYPHPALDVPRLKRALAPPH